MPISLKNTASILAYCRYSPQANSMTIAGEDNKPREIPFLGKPFCHGPRKRNAGPALAWRRNPRLEAVPAQHRAHPSPGPRLQARLLAPCPGRPSFWAALEVFSMCS